MWLSHLNANLLADAPRTSFADCFAWLVEKVNQDTLDGCFVLEIAVRMGYENIILDGDSISVINNIKKKDTGFSPIYAMYDYVHVLSASFGSFSCSFVRRSGNTVAHSSARWDTGIALEKICMEPFPNGFKALVDLDLI